MAVEFRAARQSHRFHKMKLLAESGGGKSGDMHLNVVPLVDMMMVLVIFLVMNFNATGEMLFLSKDMQMPLAEHGAEITRVPIVAVSFNPNPNPAAGEYRNGLWYEGQPLLDLMNLNLDDPDMRIPELEEKLVENRQAFEIIGGNRAEALDPSEDPTSTVNVQIDKKTDYRLVKRVLYTCELAGYGRIRLTMGDGRKTDLGGAVLPAEGEPPGE